MPPSLAYADEVADKGDAAAEMEMKMEATHARADVHMGGGNNKRKIEVEEGEKTEARLKVDRAGRKRGRENEQERRSNKRLCTFECIRPALSPFREKHRQNEEAEKKRGKANGNVPDSQILIIPAATARRTSSLVVRVVGAVHWGSSERGTGRVRYTTLRERYASVNTNGAGDETRRL
ncbi:hypothetical protein B0H14DRAFT_3175812 [Mycena olivaceomarginata]|nr:hypothetical protein B0H14DRAFT_3175812 [Mycena olivaceomarginata]